MQPIPVSVLSVIFGFMVFLLAAIYIAPPTTTETVLLDREVIEHLEQHGCPLQEQKVSE